MASPYFEIFGLVEQLCLDETKLKAKFLELSKQNHPDFFINNPEKYNRSQVYTSQLNEAYKVLSIFNTRLAYVLKQHDLLEESKNKLPQDFLMEMMDINETIMDLQMDFDAERWGSVHEEVHSISNQFTEKMNQLAGSYDQTSIDDSKKKRSLLEDLRIIYLKQKYVLRLQESLDKFASL